MCILMSTTHYKLKTTYSCIEDNNSAGNVYYLNKKCVCQYLICIVEICSVLKYHIILTLKGAFYVDNALLYFKDD